MLLLFPPKLFLHNIVLSKFPLQFFFSSRLLALYVTDVYINLVYWSGVSREMNQQDLCIYVSIIYLPIYRAILIFKELALGTVDAGNSDICSAGQHGGNSGRVAVLRRNAFIGKPHSLLLSPSANWTKSIHIMEDNLLYFPDCKC